VKATEQKAPASLGKKIVRRVMIYLGIYLLAVIAVTLMQRSFIYHPAVLPTAVLEGRAREEGLERWTNAQGERIGWKRLAETRPASGNVLVTHGNAGCAVHRGHYATALQQEAALDVFILEYPGYGDRTGSPSERSLFAAADEALGLLPSRQPVFLLGESLGTGVAAHLAGSQPGRIAGVLLVAPYDRLGSVAQRQMPIFPTRWMLRDKFRSDEALSRFPGPVAFLIAEQDEIIPARFGQRLHDGYAGKKRLWKSAEASHNSLPDQPPAFWQELVELWGLRSARVQPE
jgi:uncharacterized protein